MDYESTVEPMETESAADDAQFEDLVEEEADESLSLDEAMDDGAEEEPAEEQPQEEQGTSEPGWMRKRIDKAVQKAVAATEARLKAQYDAQMAPIMEQMLKQEAKELVKSGEFRSQERAEEYLRLKKGMNIPAVPEEPKPAKPRNDKGQFAPANDPAIETKADMLAMQVEKIKARDGVDLMEYFNSDPGIKDKVLSGEWDFYDVADHVAKGRAAKPKGPAPMRSPNGASGANHNAIENMSDEQFARLEKRIAEGARISLR